MDVCFVCVVCCQAAVSVTDWSFVHRSPTDCGASLSLEPGGHSTRWAAEPEKIINIITIVIIYVLCSPALAMASCSPALTMVSSFTKFRDHTQRRITVGRTPLDEWSARRRDLYLTTHNTHNRQTSMPLWDSNLESQNASGRRLKPYTARPLGPANFKRKYFQIKIIFSRNLRWCRKHPNRSK
jgi:hypothetical protein